jgi:hypothetical protein
MLIVNNMKICRINKIVEISSFFSRFNPIFNCCRQPTNTQYGCRSNIIKENSKFEWKKEFNLQIIMDILLHLSLIIFTVKKGYFWMSNFVSLFCDFESSFNVETKRN